ncbi:MAG TPA: hypothetical protein VEA61_12150 [Allosphingosinicella sp.]|nr:hypothetical protein [Allosphingosinicella sp.]
MASEELGDLDPEMGAMLASRKLISALEPPAQRRVLLWLADVFSVSAPVAVANAPQPAPAVASAAPPEGGQEATPSSFSEILERTEPTNNADRVLAAAFWLQEVEGRESLDGRSINKLLKEHGIDVSNVTNAFTALIERRPRLAIQAGKKGKFEKLYRLTTEGRKQVAAAMTQQE